MDSCHKQSDEPFDGFGRDQVKVAAELYEA